MLGGMPDPSLRWRVNPVLPVVKLVGAVALAALALLPTGGDLAARWAALGTAAGLLAWGARDVLAPVRVSADADGVTVVTGYARRRRLAWSQIERVRVDRRQRLGLASTLLEIDTGETLHLFSGYDLNAAPADVAEALAALRTGTG